MSDRLSKLINQEIEQPSNSSLHQPVKGKNFQQKTLLIILGIVLVILSIEGVLLIVVKNKNKGLEVENQKKVEISAEKITPVPTRIESTREGKKLILIKGKVSSFDVNDRKINLILGDNTTKTIDIDDRTIFIYVDKEQPSPPQPKMVDISTFWEGLKKDDRINCSCYEGSNLAALITKDITN